MKHRTALTLACFFMGCLAISACGYKGPPLPPLAKTRVLSPPVDLTYDLSDDTAVLSWRHEPDPADGLSPVSFEVSTAVRVPGECEGCPLVFTVADTVAMPEMSCSQTVEPGRRYYFRVRAIGENNVKSDFSPTILIEPGQPPAD